MYVACCQRRTFSKTAVGEYRLQAALVLRTEATLDSVWFTTFAQVHQSYRVASDESPHQSAYWIAEAQLSPRLTTRAWHGFVLSLPPLL